MVERLLLLEKGELHKLLPFALTYLLLFYILTIADGMSTSLFISRVGSEHLPSYYTFTSILNFVAVAVYIQCADKFQSSSIFAFILCSIALVYGGFATLDTFGLSQKWHYTFIFAAREIFYTLVLIHFGNFIADYFTKDQLIRIMPLSYAGGRIGGFLGAITLEDLTPIVGVINLSYILVLGAAGTYIAVRLIRGKFKTPESEATGISGLTMPLSTFLRTTLRERYLFWLSVSSFLFMICRWFLNFQYNTFFDHYFSSELELAVFIGSYTKYSLLIAILLQIFVVNRLIKHIGINATHMLYNFIFMVTTAANLMPMTIWNAVASKFVETELRFSIRNPVTQLYVNILPTNLRKRTRAWTLGMVNPFSTIAASSMINILMAGAPIWIPAISLCFCLTYISSCFGIYKKHHF